MALNLNLKTTAFPIFHGFKCDIANYQYNLIASGNIAIRIIEF